VDVSDCLEWSKRVMAFGCDSTICRYNVERREKKEEKRSKEERNEEEEKN
jgi:hypothetical protein